MLLETLICITVAILMSGLALCCFNKQAKNYLSGQTMREPTCDNVITRSLLRSSRGQLINPMLLKATGLLIGTILLSACGRMTINETHYYAITDGSNTNYFRLNVRARTVLGKAEYRSGWFPTRAVDAVFGDISSENGAKILSVRNDIETLYLDEVKETTKNYLEKAGDVNTDSDTLAAYQRARMRVRDYPIWDNQASPNSQIIDLDPEKGIVRSHSDEKLIFILSSDPDEVVGNIANFAESDKTVVSIQKFTGVFEQRIKNDIATKKAESEVANQSLVLLGSQSGNAATQIQSDNVSKLATARREIDVLLKLIESIQ